MAFGRAWLSDHYRRLDNLEVCEEMLPVFENGWQIKQCAITDVRVHIEAVYPSMAETVAVGDSVALAVKVTTGEVGNASLAVHFGVERLVCTNLMVVPKFTQRMIHLGSKQDEFVEVLSEQTLRAEDRLKIQKMRDIVLAMKDAERFKELVDTMKGAVKATLDNPIEASVLLGKNLNLSEGETQAVQNELVAGGISSMWGLTNALTATARSMDFERKAELEAAAGGLLDNPAAWKSYTELAA